jgi:hypothetical protein
MFILTQALNSVFIDPSLTDYSSGQPGPSYADLDRMEDFWQVKPKRLKYRFL